MTRWRSGSTGRSCSRPTDASSTRSRRRRRSSRRSGPRRRPAAPFDLVLFGNEAADTGDFQVGIRVAVALDRPVVTGIKSLAIRDGAAFARREATGGGWETYEVPLPAVVSVKEGLNLPRYPSVPGRLRAKRKEVERMAPAWSENGTAKLGLRLPEEDGAQVEILGTGPDAAPAVVDLLVRIGVLAS